MKQENHKVTKTGIGFAIGIVLLTVYSGFKSLGYIG